MKLIRRALAAFSVAASGLAVLAAAVPAHATVLAAPVLTKSFAPTSVPLNGTSTMTLTITNSDIFELTGATLSDTFALGLQVANPPNVSNDCGGTVTAVAGSTTVSLSGGSVDGGQRCTIQVDVTGVLGGTWTDPAGPVTSANAPPSNIASAELTVREPPTISKGFNVTSIPQGGSTILSFLLTNATTSAATGVAFTDNLPAGLVVATPSNASSNCEGPVTATPGSGTVSLADGSIGASTSCSVQLNVTGTTAGKKTNTVTASSTEGGTSLPSTADLTVVAPPQISKFFAPSAVALNGTTQLNFLITNPNASTTLTGVSFSDLFPPGVTATTTSAPVCGGIVTVTAAGVSLANATVNVPCAFAIQVQGTTVGTKINTTGAVSSTNGGQGNTASATLVVGSPPTISKAFGKAAIPLNSSTSLTFTLANPNAQPLTGAVFSDSLPAGLVVATPNGLTNTCGGSVTATAGSGSIALSGGTIPASNNCSITVNVKGTTTGIKNNSSSVLTTAAGLTSAGTANASVTVVGPPTLTKAFTPSTIATGATTTLTFTLTNPNPSTPLTGVTFSDPFPGGLMVASSPSVTNTCGGVPSVGPFALAVGYANGTVPAGASCTFSVRVTATSAGVKNNTTTIVASTPGGIGSPATATLAVTP